MSLAAALILAATAASAPAPEAPAGGGAQAVTAQARATILSAVIVRQASGLQETPDSPRAQVVRRGRTVLVEFE